MRCHVSVKALRQEKKGTNLSSAFLSVQALSGLDEAHTRWEGQSTYLSPPIPMLISPRNTLTDTPRNNA